MNNPIISIITVCYNAIDTIEKTILSVTNQTYSNIEYIIIDGDSTDGTLDVIKKYEGDIAYWISEPDKGIYDAMNKGVQSAKGDYLFFLNSGDVFYNESVLTNICQYLKGDSTIYYGDVLMLPNNIIYDRKFSKAKLCRHNICHQSIFYPRLVFEKYEYNLRYRIYADHILNLACLADKSINFEYIDIIVSIYPLNGISSILPDDVNYKKDFHRIILSNFGFLFFLYSMFLLYAEVIINKLYNGMSHILSNHR